MCDCSEDPMNRAQLVKQLAEHATRPIGSASAMHQPVESECALDSIEPLRRSTVTELFVWFEDTSSRAAEGRRGIAGLPESLLPYVGAMRILDRRYATDHLHLLSAVRIRCEHGAGELIASLYTAALSVGTVAWIGTGSQYLRTWHDMYPQSARAV
jgi:hypothetical protein